MRKLNHEKRTLIMRALIDGTGINATARICGVSKLTVLRLLADVGTLCADYHDLTVCDLTTVRRLELDECWGFIGCKEKSKARGKRGHGDVWIWVGICPVTKLVVAWRVGQRDGKAAAEFLWDIADRVTGRIQITTDAHPAYPAAVKSAFSDEIDYAILQKIYGQAEEPEKRYSPSVCLGVKRETVCGCPDRDCVGTSIVERSNLNLRLFNRRHTRLTLGFSKRYENHVHAIALHYFAHNFIRRNRTIGTTPAVKAGVADREWTVEDLVRLLETEERTRANSGRINRTDRP